MDALKAFQNGTQTLGALDRLLATASNPLREGGKIHLTFEATEWDALLAACTKGDQ